MCVFHLPHLITSNDKLSGMHPTLICSQFSLSDSYVYCSRSVQWKCGGGLIVDSSKLLKGTSSASLCGGFVDLHYGGGGGGSASSPP